MMMNTIYDLSPKGVVDNGVKRMTKTLFANERIDSKNFKNKKNIRNV
jgi:hypothetical protein